MKRKHTITIVYKSGAKVTLQTTEFEIKKTATGEVTTVSWGDAFPRPLAIGINDISAIFEGKA